MHHRTGMPSLARVRVSHFAPTLFRKRSRKVVCTAIGSNQLYIFAFTTKGNVMKTVIAGLNFVLALGISGSVWSQGLTGSIVGTVKDPSSASVARARIIIKNVST